MALQRIDMILSVHEVRKARHEIDPAAGNWKNAILEIRRNLRLRDGVCAVKKSRYTEQQIAFAPE